MSPQVIQDRILKRHRLSLKGNLYLETWYSESLEISKQYFVYEPPGFHHRNNYPLLYLFRGHEREWVNINEDQSRFNATAIEDLDKLISSDFIPPLVAVMPGLNSLDNHIPSLGINMCGRWRRRKKGLGKGRFWNYLTTELFPYMDRRYGRAQNGLRLMAGFSLGGFTVSLLAAKHPGYFDHAAIYDGLFTWPRHNDPRKAGRGLSDTVWCESSLLDAALGNPRDETAMRVWNATEILHAADEALLNKIGRTKFWIASAPDDGMLGNRDRARFYVNLLKTKGIQQGFSRVIHHPTASHSWHWADRFLVRFLLRAFDTHRNGETPSVRFYHG